MSTGPCLSQHSITPGDSFCILCFHILICILLFCVPSSNNFSSVYFRSVNYVLYPSLLYKSLTYVALLYTSLLHASGALLCMLLVLSIAMRHHMYSLLGTHAMSPTQHFPPSYCAKFCWPFSMFLLSHCICLGLTCRWYVTHAASTGAL